MGLQFKNLDDATRGHMLAEFDMDIATPDGCYLSNYLTAAGQQQWPGHLKDAARTGSDDSLAKALREHHCFKHQVERKKPKGGYSMVAVPLTAADTLAQGQFNLYYMRALALRAQTEDKTITVYRARASENPRPGSEEMIGSQLDPDVVLEVLRRTKGIESEIGIPMPNSGLTIHLA